MFLNGSKKPINKHQGAGGVEGRLNVPLACVCVDTCVLAWSHVVVCSWNGRRRDMYVYTKHAVQLPAIQPEVKFARGLESCDIRTLAISTMGEPTPV